MSRAAAPMAPDGGRQQRLAERVGRLRTRGRAGQLDRWLLVAGAVLMPLGFAVVVLGWVGASRTPLVFEQIPYLISGGLLGVALASVGGFLYFAYWQTVQVRESREARRDLQAVLDRLDVLAAAAVSVPTAREPVAAANGGTTLVATSRGSMLHRPGCAVIANRTDLREVAADTPGLTACGLCQPIVAGS